MGGRVDCMPALARGLCGAACQWHVVQDHPWRGEVHAWPAAMAWLWPSGWRGCALAASRRRQSAETCSDRDVIWRMERVSVCDVSGSVILGVRPSKHARASVQPGDVYATPRGRAPPSTVPTERGQRPHRTPHAPQGRVPDRPRPAALRETDATLPSRRPYPAPPPARATRPRAAHRHTRTSRPPLSQQICLPSAESTSSTARRTVGEARLMAGWSPCIAPPLVWCPPASSSSKSGSS